MPDKQPWEVPANVAATAASMLIRTAIIALEQAIQILQPYQPKIETKGKTMVQVMHMILVTTHNQLVENIRAAGLGHVIGDKDEDAPAPPAKRP